jgi:hypothetical protein
MVKDPATYDRAMQQVQQTTNEDSSEVFRVQELAGLK